MHKNCDNATLCDEILLSHGFISTQNNTQLTFIKYTPSTTETTSNDQVIKKIQQLATQATSPILAIISH